ncbi:MAG: methyl-accepting chemotaxis protein [Magnetococcus sp. DMHC-6]
MPNPTEFQTPSQSGFTSSPFKDPNNMNTLGTPKPLGNPFDKQSECSGCFSSIMGEFARSFDKSAKRWELIVYPSLFAFIILAMYGFFLIYSLTQDIRTMAVSIDPLMGRNMGSLSVNIKSLSDNMEQMSTHLEYISDNMETMSVDMQGMAENIGHMTDKIGNMDKNITEMTHVIATVSTTMTTMAGTKAPVP